MLNIYQVSVCAVDEVTAPTGLTARPPCASAAFPGPWHPSSRQQPCRACHTRVRSQPAGVTFLPIAAEDRGCAPDLTLHSRFHHVMRWQRADAWGDVYVWECRLRFLVTFSFIYCVCKCARGGERTTVALGLFFPHPRPRLGLGHQVETGPSTC